MLPAVLTSSVEQEQEFAVIKANTLVRKAHFNLTEQEQKIILYCISKIKPTDTDFQEYKFDLKHLCKICGIELNGKNYKNFKDTIKKLSDKSFWFEAKNEEYLCRWIQDVTINKNETSVSITLGRKLKPYLLQLKENYTKYSLKYILSMNSKYSIRIFELMQSYSYLNQIEISIEDLKAILQSAEYPVFSDFRRKVIEPAIKEINKYTYLNVSYKPIRQNRKIHSLLFTIEKKENIMDRIAADVEREKILNG